MAFLAVIPARYASTRLSGKPLLDICGRPMVVRVAERAALSGAAEVLVATDHAEIAAATERYGFRALMTRVDHTTGTDRLAEVATRLGCSDEQIIVNVQGDEPLIDPALIGGLAEALECDPQAAIATAAHALRSVGEFLNPNVVKVVDDSQGRALYFSRAPIPYPRDALPSPGGDGTESAAVAAALPEGLPAKRHIGSYAYRAGFLKRYAALKPAPIEEFEALEQLRALWYGYRIRVVIVESVPEAGVDTLEDLERVRRRFDRKGVCG